MSSAINPQFSNLQVGLTPSDDIKTIFYFRFIILKNALEVLVTYSNTDVT